MSPEQETEIAALLQHLESGNADERRKAIVALGRLKAEVATESLIGILKDSKALADQQKSRGLRIGGDCGDARCR